MRSPRPVHGRPGSALVWVLLLVVFLSGLCLFFFNSGREANLRSGANLDELRADELLDSASGEILAKLEEGFSIEDGSGSSREGSTAAMPGLLEMRLFHTPLNRGAGRGSTPFEGSVASPQFFSQPFAATYDGMPANPRWIPMFSWKSFAPRLKNLSVGGGSNNENPEYNPFVSFNINTPDQPWNPGTTWITGVPSDSGARVRGKSLENASQLVPGVSSAERPIWVQWIPVLKDPSRPPSASNPMIGRYAYWVDVENTKLRADEPLRSFRHEPAAGRLLGESGEIDGGRAAFDQDGGNSSRGVLAAMEDALPGKTIEGVPMRRDGSPGPGFAAPYAVDARESWLGPSGPAAAADLVDWTYFETPRREGIGDRTVGDLLSKTLAQTSDSDRPVHPWFIDLEKAMEKDEEKVRLARQVATSLTFHGEEENVDPLGNVRVDLRDFQKSATSNRAATISAASIMGSEVYGRLGDGNYHRAYQPGARGRSFFDSLAPFSANGQSAALQMLVNIAEAAQPDNVPPVIDTGRGIVGARSMPYVAEISTRARSAYWLLPEEDRKDPAKLLQTTTGGAFSYTYNQKRLHYYATHAVLNLCVGLVNPNPFETGPFNGEIEFDITWSGLPNGATVEKTFKAPLNGYFNVNSLAGKESKELQPLGHTVCIRLGVFPVSSLNDDRYGTCMRIRGWKIRRGGEVWHHVPVKHPGASGFIDWWRMAQPGTNAGSPADENSLAGYQNGGGRAVGWFCMDTLDALIPQSLGVTDWTNANATDAPLKTRVSTWMDLTPKTAVLERVVCLDPVLGHRTGNPMLPGLFGRGHFYGAQGHFWRRQRTIKMQSVVYVGQTQADAEKIKSTRWQVSPLDVGSRSVKVQRESGDHLVSSSSNWPVTSATAELLDQREGECLTHKLIVPGSATGSDEPKQADSLTAVYRIPSLEGNAGPGRLGIPSLPVFTRIDSANTIENVDVETAEPQNFEKNLIKLPDGKKGARGFFCSAPAKRYFNSPGEIGFCHSGFPLTPILLGPEEGRTPYQLNNPMAGPPMRVLLDLFDVPVPGRRWNVNTSVAHDEYMALREGGDGAQELKESVSVSSMPARAVWLPAATGFVPRADGSDAYRGKEAKNLAEKNPGFLLDRRLSPFPTLRRPWDMWLGVVGGDFSRSGESRRWGVGNTAFDYFGPGYFTWKPGAGVGDGPWLDFGSEAPALGKLLAFGSDGRKDDKNEGTGTLKGRFASDQNLSAIDGDDFRLPAHFATRFGLLPVRHFRSDLALDFHQENHESGWLRFKTALNPGIGATLSSGEMRNDKDAAEAADGASFPGGHHGSGVFYQAPMALIANQAGFSANAFTAYVVVEAIRDHGKKREGVNNSGPGHCDADDEVLARRWARLLILKETGVSGPPRFRIALKDTAGK